MSGINAKTASHYETLKKVKTTKINVVFVQIIQIKAETTMASSSFCFTVQ